MSWSTELYTSISFNRKTYDALYVIEDDIEEYENLIRLAEKELTELAFITEPQKFCDEEQSPENYVRQKLENALEILEENLPLLSDLQRLRDAWDKATYMESGKVCFKKRPDDFHWDDAFIEGDYINSNYNDDENV